MTRRLLSLAIFIGTAFASQSHADTTLRGIHMGARYDITFAERENTVKGTWGAHTYDLKIDKNYHKVTGMIDKTMIMLQFESAFKKIKGEVLCGKTELVSSRAFRTVTGYLCGAAINLKLNPQENADLVTYALALDALADPLPLPAHDAIKNFTAARIRF